MPAILLLLALLAPSSFAANTPPSALVLEVYATSGQVNQSFATEESRKAALEKFRALGITKVYLEVVRGGEHARPEILLAARDFFRANGVEAAAGVATLPGPDYGVGSNGTQYAMNYEAPETREALRGTMEFCAREFDEIIVDDFLMTDDESEVSVKARGDRSWSEYRLDLLTEIARDVLIAPAKAVNPNVSITLKFPQWYDRFHVYGYNPETAIELFDRIWVGAETRDPETLRFGYTQPTEGFVNFSWLRSIGGEKVQGAWFDHIECDENVFIMQAFQSILAGASHITLFNLGNVLGDDPAEARFKQRLDALQALYRLVYGRSFHGVAAYKPPHSDPGRDTYLYDFLVAAGVPIQMNGTPPKDARSILLSAHSAADPEIASRLKGWLDQGSTVLTTPGFFEAAKSPEINKLCGFGEAFPGKIEHIQARKLLAGSVAFPASPEVRIVVPSVRADHKALAEVMVPESVPVLTEHAVSKGKVLVLYTDTFDFSVFDTNERFLTPIRIDIPRWPDRLAYTLQSALSLGGSVEVMGVPSFGTYVYDDGVIVLANFTKEAAAITAYVSDCTKIWSFDVIPEIAAFGEDVLRGMACCGQCGESFLIPPWDVVAIKANVK